MNEFELDNICKTLRDSQVEGAGIRVSSKTAKWLLLNNKSFIGAGRVFWLNIKNLGMGVYKVTKAPLSQKETKMIK